MALKPGSGVRIEDTKARLRDRLDAGLKDRALADPGDGVEPVHDPDVLARPGERAGVRGEQTAPLGRAVVGGLAASALATLVLLPAVFAVVQRRTSVAAASLDPDDPRSRLYDEDQVKLFDDGPGRRG